MKHRALARTMPKLERPPWGSDEPMSTQEAEAGESMMQDARYLKEDVTGRSHESERIKRAKHPQVWLVSHVQPPTTNNALPFAKVTSAMPPLERA